MHTRMKRLQKTREHSTNNTSWRAWWLHTGSTPTSNNDSNHDTMDIEPTTKVEKQQLQQPPKSASQRGKISYSHKRAVAATSSNDDDQDDFPDNIPEHVREKIRSHQAKNPNARRGNASPPMTMPDIQINDTSFSSWWWYSGCCSDNNNNNNANNMDVGDQQPKEQQKQATDRTAAPYRFKQNSDNNHTFYNKSSDRIAAPYRFKAPNREKPTANDHCSDRTAAPYRMKKNPNQVTMLHHHRKTTSSSDRTAAPYRYTHQQPTKRM